MLELLSVYYYKYIIFYRFGSGFKRNDGGKQMGSSLVKPNWSTIDLPYLRKNFYEETDVVARRDPVSY